MAAACPYEAIARAAHEQINFLLTNRIPRRLATLFMGWFSQVELPIVRDLSLAVWKLFAGDLNPAIVQVLTCASAAAVTLPDRSDMRVTSTGLALRG